MLIERITGYYKPGKEEEGLAFLVEELNRAFRPLHYRTLIPQLGTIYRYTTDLEFPNLSERDQFWTTWGASPEARAFLEKWYPLIETGEMHEIWELI